MAANVLILRGMTRQGVYMAYTYRKAIESTLYPLKPLQWIGDGRQTGKVLLMMVVASVTAIVHSLLVISGDVEENPGPLGQHTKDNLDTQCCEEHLYKIATFSFDWKTVGKRLIGSKIIEDISREEQNEQNKRDKMLEKWLEIKGSKATYRVLFDVLKDVQNTQVAEEVQKLASSIATEADKSSPPQAVEQQHLISSTVKHRIMDNCGCGRCDLKGLITNGCSNPLYQQYLYLDAGTLTKNEKDSLLLKVKADADAISKDHLHMILKFNTWMEDNVPVKNYRTILFNIPGTIRKEVPMLRDRWKEIKVADHTECSVILSDYYTWFNCDVLKIVLQTAKTLTQKDPKDMLSTLQSYTEELHKYCKRNIFECPPPSSMSPTKGTTYFSLKLERYQVLDQKTFTAEEIQLFEATLMTSLNIEQYVLKLCTVAEGCVELVYSVPLCIYSVLFPLNEEQWKYLVTLGVTELMTKNYHYKRENTTLLLLASKAGHHDVVQTLLGAGADVNAARSDDGQSPLWTASFYGHLEVVKQLIEAGANVNQVNKDGQGPLWKASFKGHLAIVKKLIEAGANVNQATKDNTTPLYIASQEGHHDVVQSLLGAGADMNVTQSDCGRSPLLAASFKGHLAVVKKLIEAGANINQANKDNTTPLYVASQKGHHDVVHSLLGAGADVNTARSDDGRSPLWTASFNGHLAVVEKLIEAGANVNQANKDNTTPLYVASQQGHHDVVHTLLGAGADVNVAESDCGQSPLLAASFEGHLAVVQKLIEAGANVNQANKDNTTPLYVASRKGHHDVVQSLLGAGADMNTARSDDGRSALWTASFSGHLAVVKKLIEAGAKVNQAYKCGRSPLWTASFNGHLDVVKKLIEAGANVDQTDKNNKTPLYVASQQGHHDVVQSLLGAGADVNVTESDDGRSTLWTASFSGHLAVVEKLIEAGANVNQGTQDGRSPLWTASFNGHLEVVEKLIETGAKVNQANKDNTTPLYVASVGGHHDVVQSLLGAGADVNTARSDNNATPLHAASTEGHTEVVQILLEAGANVNIMATSHYKTPLYLASQEGHTAIVQMLVRAGADVNIPDVNNITPLDVALQNGHDDVVQTLLEMGNTSEHYFPPEPIIPRIYAAPTVTKRQPHDMIRSLLQDMNVGDTVHVHRPPTLEEQWPEAKEFVHKTVQKMSGMSERTK